MIDVSDINSLAVLRETREHEGVRRVFFHHTHSYKVLPTYTLPLGSGRQTEAGSSLCPVSWRREEEEEDEEVRCKGRIQ